LESFEETLVIESGIGKTIGTVEQFGLSVDKGFWTIVEPIKKRKNGEEI